MCRLQVDGLRCASPRCQHLNHEEVATKPVGTLGHDTGMWEAIAKAIATLPMRGGGLGLRSASMAPAAFWASWADALPTISERLPERLPEVTDQLSNGQNLDGYLRELASASEHLDRHGSVGRPSWADIRRGPRPPVTVSVELGEWRHGWQHHTSSSSECHFRETVMFAQSCAAKLIRDRTRVQGQKRRVPRFSVEPPSVRVGQSKSLPWVCPWHFKLYARTPCCILPHFSPTTFPLFEP